jgi:glucose/arabinose dehydrogenase
MKTRARICCTIGLGIVPVTTGAVAQPGPLQAPLGDGPWEFTTYEQGGTPIRVSVVTKGLTQPWSLVWLPNGDALITERAGQLRVMRDRVLDPRPIGGRVA